jgi:hypothetical protein
MREERLRQARTAQARRLEGREPLLPWEEERGGVRMLCGVGSGGGGPGEPREVKGSVRLSPEKRILIGVSSIFNSYMR